MYTLTRDEVRAYLKRIGISEIGAPTLLYLAELHKAHVKHLSWQTLDIFGGKPAPIGFKESVALILNRRSGYCFHLNGAFGVLLHSLGYRVNLHRAGVQPMGAEPRINSFHLGLTVDFSDEEAGRGTWIAEVGLGDMPFEPLPLRHGTFIQEPYTYKVTESGVAADGWRLEHDHLASFPGVDYAPDVLTDLEEFKPNHEFYIRSEDSPWFNKFLIRQRNETEGNELRGCIWRKRNASGLEKTELHTKSQWFEVLAGVFDEQLVNYSKPEREELWKRVEAAHSDWQKIKERQEKAGSLPTG
ncbi:arylamine N-acetyltransferase [Paenibacillus chitinolyticus]|uniref:Arylamine N-acetyltransferase n=1 Tax=Paenibacillus chitinolyticus TaxID=79263 RepID=A0A410WZ76_9BACL|nr:arylamine N-acetyltransferase [Paenibacillus chitinolyticus]MCY9590261.1 arylamine N-acetyltransferase [Paenibacillus chitinolyticus]MCY9596957.1 arylamine N-acetyltransferase [Paenibacillus chitinolyticus]QAV19738.1 arylamine N-acetyltransferase [Paenibacillus chitinolyticus]